MSHPAIDKMLAAQDIERELKILKDQAEAVSIPLERTKARRQSMRRDLQNLEDKLSRTIQERRQAEKDLAEIEGKLASIRTRQSTARNSKEAQAFEHEMENAQSTVAATEETALALMDQEETLTARREQETARINRDFKTIDTEIQRLSGLLQEKQNLAKDLREERIAAINRMDEETRESYEWLVKKHGPASAVAHVSGAACGGCGAMLLPDQMMKLRNSQELHRCTHCHRFLIQEDE